MGVREADWYDVIRHDVGCALAQSGVALWLILSSRQVKRMVRAIHLNGA